MALSLGAAIFGIGLTLQAAPRAIPGAQTQQPKPTPANAKHVKTKDLPRLKPGAPVEREISAGQTHQYRIKLRAGEFMRVTVGRRDVDVTLILSDPNGAQLAEVKPRKERQEEESLLFVAESRGAYLLEARASKDAEEKAEEKKEAPAATASRYRVELAELRASTERDRNRASAERKIEEADLLRAENKPDPLRQAAAKYQEAIALLRSAGDRRREADAIGGLGAAYSSLNEHPQAREQYNQALAIRRELKDRAGEAGALNSIGMTYNAARDYKQAIEYFEQALAIGREVKDERRQASALTNVSVACYSSRDFEKAVDRATQAVALWRKLGEWKQEAGTLGVIASSYEAWNKREQALEYFAKVRDLRREMKDRDGEAQALFDLGVVARDVGDNRKALEYFEASLQIWRAAGNRGREASALNFLGLVHRTLGNKERALEYYTQALALSRELKNQRLEATLLNNLGGLFYSLGEKRKAIENFQKAVELQQAAKNSEGEASALNNVGGIHADLGENEQALKFYNQALPIWQSINRRREEGITLNNIGETYDRLGEKQQALDRYAQALATVRAVEARQDEARILTNIGTVYSSLGERQSAIEYYQQALAICRKVGDLTSEADIYHLLGYLYYELGDKQKSLEFHNQALPLWQKLGDKRGEANTLAAVGYVYRDMNEPQKALEYLNRALPLHVEVGNRGGQSDTLTHLGIVYNDLGQTPKAIECLDQSLSLAQAVTDPHREAKARFELARVRMALGELEQARPQIEETLRLVETLRSKVAAENLRVSYFATVQRYYDLYIELLMRMNEKRQGEGFDGMALQAAERAHARNLLDLLAEASADIRNGADPALIERERSLQALLSAKANLQVGLRSNPQTQAAAEDMGKEIQSLAADLQEVRAQLRVKSPRYAALTQPQPLTLTEIQKQVLDPGTLLLAYSLGEERSFLWAVTTDSIRSYSLPKREEIEAASRDAYELLSSPPAMRAEAAEGRRLKHGAKREAEDDPTAILNELSRMLLAPAAEQLGAKRLVIVADGALQYVPFAALPEPAIERKGERPVGRKGKIRPVAQPPGRPAAPSPLIVNHEIVSLPSASTIAVLRKELEGRQPAPKALALLADPVFERDDERVKVVTVKAEKQSETAPTKVAEERLIKHLKTNSSDKPGTGHIARLPYTRREAEQISSMIPESELKQSLDFDASRATATGAELGQYRFVHFATHGYLDSEQPELSALVLSMVDQQGARQNGFLRAHEIFNLKLPAEMVVLSACETGLGKEVRGEGLVGLTRGFMYAGAARVVVSLWALNDRATADLMASFYQKMLKEGLRPAAALRAAQVEMSRRPQWQAPYFWAGFTLQGEWR
jgi:CHAT domain-containing protein/Tfp pilus assembly protein PilF